MAGVLVVEERVAVVVGAVVQGKLGAVATGRFNVR